MDLRAASPSTEVRVGKPGKSGKIRAFLVTSKSLGKYDNSCQKSGNFTADFRLVRYKEFVNYFKEDVSLESQKKSGKIR